MRHSTQANSNLVLLARHSVPIRFHWEMFHRTVAHSRIPFFPGQIQLPPPSSCATPQEVPRPSKAAGNSEHQFPSRYRQTVVHWLASGLVTRLLPLSPAGDSRNIVCVPLGRGNCPKLGLPCGVGSLLLGNNQGWWYLWASLRRWSLFARWTRWTSFKPLALCKRGTD